MECPLASGTSLDCVHLVSAKPRADRLWHTISLQVWQPYQPGACFGRSMSPHGRISLASEGASLSQLPWQVLPGECHNPQWLGLLLQPGL